MAIHSVAKSKHATLTASTVDEVTLTDPFDEVEVINRSGAAEIYFTVDGPAPAVGGDNTEVLPAVAGAALTLRVHGTHYPGVNIEVNLISTGTEAYTVVGR